MRPASDMEDYKAAWNERIEVIERLVLAEIDKLAATGFTDKRLCAISRTNFEQAIMALQKALRIGSSDTQRDYGKQTMPDPMPSQFAPPPDPEPYRNRGAQGQQTQANTEAVPRVDWQDYGAGSKSGEN